MSELDDQIKSLEDKLEPLKKQRSEIYQQEAEETEKNIKLCHALKYKFNDDDLVFAAYVRCECGCGFAYPKKIGMHGAWYCSGILLGEADAKAAHTSPMPFMFYEIKSENQPSANGATTRK